MTYEEKQLIDECRIIIAGTGEFSIYIKEKLCKLGFEKIENISESHKILNNHNTGILIVYNGTRLLESCNVRYIPVIYTFDFIDGAGAIVLFPDDCRDWLDKQNIRLWAAEYMSGYCAFWNVVGCDWIHDALPEIKGNKTNVTALKTAADLCAKIAANLAVGRDVKRYPRFYLCKNLE